MCLSGAEAGCGRCTILWSVIEGPGPMGTRLLCTDNPLAKLAVIFMLNHDGLEDVDSSFTSHGGGVGIARFLSQE